MEEEKKEEEMGLKEEEMGLEEKTDDRNEEKDHDWQNKAQWSYTLTWRRKKNWGKR